jgi:hypothetical protein
MYRSVALAAAFLLTASAARADIIFNDGTTSGTFAGFDPAPGNVLNVGVTTAANNWVANGGSTGPLSTAFTAFGQANVAGLITSSGTIPLPGGYTFVFGLPEQITNVTGPVGGLNSSVQFTFNPSAPPGAANYFQFFKTGGGSDLNGTNFAGSQGQLVLSGHFTAQGAAPGTFGNSGTTGALDQFLTNNYPNNNTLGGTGNVALKGIVDYANPAFFSATNPGETLVGGAVNLSTQLQLPFITVDPSAAFLIGTTTTAVGASPVTSGAGLGTQTTGLGIGPINGNGAADNNQVQQDANVTVSPITTSTPNTVPEPVSLAVFAGVMGVGGLVYRRRTAKAAA